MLTVRVLDILLSKYCPLTLEKTLEAEISWDPPAVNQVMKITDLPLKQIIRPLMLDAYLIHCIHGEEENIIKKDLLNSLQIIDIISSSLGSNILFHIHHILQTSAIKMYCFLCFLQSSF